MKGGGAVPIHGGALKELVRFSDMKVHGRRQYVSPTCRYMESDSDTSIF